MQITRNQTGATEPIQTTILDSNNSTLTGLTDIVVSIRRVSDNYFFDFSDNTFKSSGWITKQQTLTEIDATEAPGEYSYSWDTSLITNETTNDTYIIRVDQAPLDQAANVPQFGEIKAGQYVDYLDASITATETAIRGSDSDDLKTISDQIDGVPAATDTVLSSSHGAGSWVGLGAPATIADAVWNALFAGYETADTMGYIMKLIRALVTAGMKQDPTANEWIINDPDTGTPWIRFDTTNAVGDPASVSIYERVPK